VGERLTLRPMTEADLALVGAWLARPHVARWWLEDPAEAAVRQRYLPAITGADPTHLLVAELDARPIGFAQWYRWDDESEADRRDIGAEPGDVGIDYAIGEADACGHGTGTTLIAALVAEVHRHHPGASLLTDPEQANIASCRVLEKNGFRLVDVRRIESEPGDGPSAIYRLDPA